MPVLLPHLTALALSIATTTVVIATGSGPAVTAATAALTISVSPEATLVIGGTPVVPGQVYTGSVGLIG